MKMETKYDHSAIEQKWQKKWLEDKIYQPDLDSATKPYYNLMMFPYPSAEGMHVGNMYAQTGGDIHGRLKRMQGYDVFQPMGLDGFGIHSENYALKVGSHPMDQAERSEANFYRQMRETGSGFAWDNTVETWKEDYYKWTQWVFIELFKAGLAYRAAVPVNFCPSCKTVLADEQVVQKAFGGSTPEKESSLGVEPLRTVGVCERCDTPVEKRDLEQWMFRITSYAEQLLEGLDRIDWTEKVKIAQRNWIGKSQGALIKFFVIANEVKQSNSQSEIATSSTTPHNDNFEIEVFTTRPDTLYGATFLVLSPEHPFVEELLQSSIVNRQSLIKVGEYVEESKAKKDTYDEKDKSGIFSGAYALNPINNQQLPIWIADYVLMGYGTGAIMAVPAHDERDFEFAKKYALPIVEVVASQTGAQRENEERRDGGCGVVFDPESQKYAVASYSDGILRLYAGGVDEKEDMQEGILREIREESGLYDFEYIENMRTTLSHFFNSRKKVNRVALATCLLVVLKNIKTQPTHLEEHEVGFELVWKTPEEILANWNEHNNHGGFDHWITYLHQSVGRAIELGYDKTSDPQKYKTSAYVGPGVLINSGDWTGWDSSDREKILADLSKRGIGTSKTTYHLRDWLISRQRYWGPPIPMIYCQSCADKGKSWFTSAKAGKINDEGLMINEEEVDHQSSIVNRQSESNGWYPSELPVILPRIDDYKPIGDDVKTIDGKAVTSPLGNHPEFYEVTCPECGGQARRETDVSDTFLDSSWYFLRYLATDLEHIPFPMNEEAARSVIAREAKQSSPQGEIATSSMTPRNDKEYIRNLELEIRNSVQRTAWMPVTIYTGGAEHSVLHLLYSRFVTKAFKDIGLISHFDEPFPRFFAHGLIVKDGSKMSKSKGNVIVPDAYIKKFGADTLRTYLMFLGPFDAGGDFRDSGIEGMNRFIKRVWTLISGVQPSKENNAQGLNPQELSQMHKTIQGVTEDLETFHYNTAIAKIMTYYNYLSKKGEVHSGEAEALLKLLAPFAPHMTEELYQSVILSEERRFGEASTLGVTDLKDSSAKPQNDKFQSIHTSSWPSFDPQAIQAGEIVVAVQVNGKLRSTLRPSSLQSGRQAGQALKEEEIVALAREQEGVQKHLAGKTVKKIIYVPGKILNFVVT